MTGSTGGPLRRVLRRFLLGSGPLKRRSDRVQALGRVLVVLAVLAAAPLGVVAAALAHDHLAAEAAAQAADRHATWAVVLTGGGTGPADWRDPRATARAEVSWFSPSGSVRHGTLAVPAGTAIGAPVAVWVDRSGALASGPMDARTVECTSLAVGAAATVAVLLAVWSLYGGLTLVLDAHRRRGWTQDWIRVEREWCSGLR